MRTWGLSAGLSLVAACSAVPIDPWAVPVGEFSENQRERVRYILADVAAVVPLEGAEVRSRADVYDFLLSEMPFTGGVVRELNRGTWNIYRHPEKPERDVFYVKEPDGMLLRFELVHRDGTRRFYVSKGLYPVGILGTLEGLTLVVLQAVPEGGVVRTGAVVYVRVETPGFNTLAKAARGRVEAVVREKSGYFVQAARWVAETAAERPDWLYAQVKGSKEVDQEVLEVFRRRFLAP